MLAKQRLQGINVFQFTSEDPETLPGDLGSDPATFLEWYNAVSSGHHDAVVIPHVSLNPYTSLITNFYNYGYDTELEPENYANVNFFADDTYDMFDDGEYISFVFTRGGNTTSYSDVAYGSEVNEGFFGYLVTRPDTYNSYNDIGSGNNTSQITRGWPLVAFGWTANLSTIRLRVTGNLGSDGEGETDSNDPVSYTAVHGRSGTIWTRNNYDTSDPSMAHVWFTVGSSEWGSSIGTATVSIDSDNGDIDSYVEVTGSNFALFHILLARKDDVDSDVGAIPASEITAFVEAFVGDMVFQYL